MSKGKLAKWVNDNIVLLVGIPLIFGIHYGWSKLQDNPYLVDQSTKKEMPIIKACLSIKNKILEVFNRSETSNTVEPQEK